MGIRLFRTTGIRCLRAFTVNTLHNKGEEEKVEKEEENGETTFEEWQQIAYQNQLNPQTQARWDH